ncbi:RagB/SusD family nutrient uptake outer membrane protein [Aggregatimonas sangjinii]|uniref:RagB/SusD family nutrient uptake outer membrane protein n=1 Tax=Aggregatimonas sangjinii TaxID=2583587 RepID=A0A5B7ST51_9FLAO|nr:RagB/SusD family nutrient uptake outer membrane protein [Aggregatimonas sangjinii]QCX01955.1 RagB/SusD family nutrient uptake outer membrane protein [Aggregatimonas sangjinii]
MRNLKYLGIFVALATVVACSDLEEVPVGRLSPDGLVQSPADVQTLINGAIGNMATERYWGRKLSLPIMLRSDMVSIGDLGTPGRRQEVNNFSMGADNGMVTALWPKAYEVIAGTNEAIFSANNLDAEPAQIDPVRAQAHFFRAYTYYHLVRLFGSIPYLDAPVEDINVALSISKTSADEVYSNIIADLEEAKLNLPDVQPTTALPSKATAAAFLASVYLTLGDFQKAYDEAKFVIDREGDFGLALEADYQDLFNAGVRSSEPLLTLDFNGFSDGDTGRDYAPALTGIRANERGNIGGGWSVAVPTINVYNRWDGRDYRKAVSLDTTGIFNGVEESFDKFPEFDSRNIQSAYIAKYTRLIGASGTGNGRASSLNYNLMRYAEVLLIAAEALNEITPGSDEAAGYVNRVRERARNGNDSGFPEDIEDGMSQDEFRDMVLEERKWELAFEFKRWYDIKRRQLGSEVFGPDGLEPQPNFDPARDYLFPLPGDELERNPNLAPNNPGY